MLNLLDLFSGIGGFSKGLEDSGGFKTRAFCEIDPFCRKVLAKHWPETFIHDDIKTLTRETLCRGYAQNAVLNQLCKEMGGNIASVRVAITNTRKLCGKETLQSIMNGPQNAEEALSIIMAGNVCAAEYPNTHFWQLTTNLITEARSGARTKAPCGSLLSSADILTIIKFFVTTATWQNPSTVPAHINKRLGINDDVRALTAERLAADGIEIDAICGGPPCQDLSRANGVWSSRPGLRGARSGLWSEYARLVRELRPQYVIVENVPDLLPWLGIILGDLAEIGYDAEWDCLHTTVVGGRCPRERVWLVSYPGVKRLQWQHGEGKPEGNAGGVFDALARSAPQISARQDWLSEPAIPRVVDGTPNRMDRRHRTNAIGNAVVPQIAEALGRAILQADCG